MGLGIYVAATLAGMLLIEVVAGRHKGIYNRNDLLTTALCLLFGTGMATYLSSFFIASALAWAIPQYRGRLSGAPFWPSFIVLFLVAELAFYWGHRLAHERIRLPGLWKLHRTHHAASYLNVTVMARVNIFWHFVVPTVYVTGTAIYLGMDKQVSVFMLLILSWNAFTHSDILWDAPLRKNPTSRKILNIVEHVFTSPNMHHTHHGYGTDGKLYRNFAVMFSFYDWIFGTIHIPKGRPAHYGVPGAEPVWYEQVFYPALRARNPKDTSST
jgi:sterol desaturase/sphingolipid hydroxylase (fatty acid hydroxylase superfamily)